MNCIFQDTKFWRTVSVDAMKMSSRERIHGIYLITDFYFDDENSQICSGSRMQIKMLKRNERNGDAIKRYDDSTHPPHEHRAGV